MHAAIPITQTSHIKDSHRVMIKLSGEAIKDQRWDNPFDGDFLDNLSKKIISLVESWKQVAVLLWWGNIYRWVQWTKHGIRRRTGDFMGMMATVMNWLALQDFLAQNKQRSHVMCAFDLPRCTELFVMDKAIEYLRNNRVVICVGWTWNPFFTTDTWAVQRALELGCDIMVKATKVDGVYDKDPMKFKDAQRYETLTLTKALHDGLNIMDHAAIALAMDNKLPLYVCRIGDIEKLGEDIGTLVTTD